MQNSMVSIDSQGDAKEQRIQIKNRRKRYLDLHPEFFHSLDLELTDPLFFQVNVRRFQTSLERERHNSDEGIQGIMVASENLSEAKRDAVDNPDPSGEVVCRQMGDGSIVLVEDDVSREEAWKEWVDTMTQRFLMGKIPNFNYAPIDGGEEFDDREEQEREALERYFETEDDQFDGPGSSRGETGIQDF